MTYIISQIHSFFLGRSCFLQSDPLGESLHERWPSNQSKENDDHGSCDDGVVVFGLDLQAKGEGDDPSDHAWKPAHFELACTHDERLIKQPEKQGKGVYYNGSYDGYSYYNEHT